MEHKRWQKSFPRVMVEDVWLPLGYDVAEAVVRSPDLWLPQVVGRGSKDRVIGIDDKGTPSWHGLEKALAQTVGWNSVDVPHVVIIVLDDPLVAMAHAGLVIASGLPCVAFDCGYSHNEWERLYREIEGKDGDSRPILEVLDSTRAEHYLEVIRRLTA